VLDKPDSKFVLVVQCEHLLAGGIARLLDQENDIRVVDKTFTTEAMLVDEIVNSKPSVVVINESLEFADVPTLLGVLKTCPDLRLIVVNEKKNLIHVYDKHDLTITRVADLLDAVREDLIPSEEIEILER